MSITKRMLRLGVAVMVAATGWAGFATPSALAAPPCTYAGCNGKDPETTGCGKDAVTKDSLQASLILAELRWSPSCHAFWTRIRWDPANGGIGQYALIQGGKWNENGDPTAMITYTSNPEGNPWTKMISQAYPWEIFCVYTANDDGCRRVTF